MKKSSFLLIAALCFSLCTSAYAQDQNSLELPAIPKTLKAPAERADYLLEHFWDALDAATDNRSADSLFMEQTFVNFLSVMPHASAEGRAKGATAMYSKLKPSDKAKNLIRTLAEEYLYSPASPMRDENLYVLLLQSDATTADDDDASGIRNRELAKELLKNIPGTQAADFGIELANGATTTLRQVGGIPMLLLIYDPDCHTCHEAMEALANDADIQKAIADGKIAILAVAAETDRELWLTVKDTLPQGWISAFDTEGITEAELYYLPEVPGLYLLDGDQRVLDRNIPAALPSGAANPAILTILLGGNNR